MKYRTFGRLGWKVSEIGFGAWAIGGGWGKTNDDESVAALNRALDLGCNFIDTAQGYGNGHSEQVIARALKERSSKDRVYIATKIPPSPDGEWPPTPYEVADERYSEKYLRERLEQSLRDLQVDCIDIVQLHTWTRAWNQDPKPLEVLRKFQKEGKILGIGMSTPEHDQNALVQLIRDGWLDSVQIIYNIFEQEPQAELFPAAKKAGTGVIVRMPFDESALTGKLTKDTKFESGDFRNRYFEGDRLERAATRAQKVKETLGADEPNMPTAAIKFSLKPDAVSTVIPGMRTIKQAEANVGVSDEKPMSDALEKKLRKHMWTRAFWYAGK